MVRMQVCKMGVSDTLCKAAIINFYPEFPSSFLPVAEVNSHKFNAITLKFGHRNPIYCQRSTSLPNILFWIVSRAILLICESYLHWAHDCNDNWDSVTLKDSLALFFPCMERHHHRHNMQCSDRTTREESKHECPPYCLWTSYYRFCWAVSCGISWDSSVLMSLDGQQFAFCTFALVQNTMEHK